MKKKTALIRLISLVLCVGMILAMLPAVAFAEEPTVPTTPENPATTTTTTTTTTTEPPKEGGGERLSLGQTSETVKFDIVLSAGDGAFPGGEKTLTLTLQYESPTETSAALPALTEAQTPVAPEGKLFDGFAGYAPGTPVSAGATYTAKYANKCTVTFDAGANGKLISGGERVQSKTVTVKEGALPTAPGVDAEIGYKAKAFSEWTNGGVAVTGDVTITVQYDVCPYATFTFSADPAKGTVSQGSAAANVGDAIPAAPSVAANVGYAAAGFVADGGTDAYPSGTVTEEMGGKTYAYAAAFTEVPTGYVVFNAGSHGKLADESASVKIHANAGDEVDVPSVAADSEWALTAFTAEGASLQPGDKVTVAADTTLTYTAQYRGTFTITYDAGAFGRFPDGESAKSVTAYSDEALGAAPVPVAEANYEYVDYPNDPAGTYPTASAIYTATYQPKDATPSAQYKITTDATNDTVGIGAAAALNLVAVTPDAHVRVANVVWTLSDNSVAVISGSGASVSLKGLLGGSTIATATFDVQTQKQKDDGTYKNDWKTSLRNVKAYKTVAVTAYTVSLYSNFPAGAHKLAYDGSKGGEIVSATNTYAVMQFALNEKLTLTEDYTCTDCTMTGWNTAADGSGTRYAVGAELTVDKNYTLFAQWTEPSKEEPVRVKITYTGTSYEALKDKDGNVRKDKDGNEIWGNVSKTTTKTTGFMPTLDAQGNITGITVLFLKNQESAFYDYETNKLVGWNIGQGQTVALGALETIPIGRFTKTSDASGTLYTLTAKAIYQAQTKTYPATFYVLKRTLEDTNNVTASGNYFYVGMGTVKIDAVYEKNEQGQLVEIYEDNKIYSLTSETVDKYISASPSPAQVAAYINEPVEETANIRWYKIIKTRDGWHVDGMLYTVGRYWNINYVALDENGDLKTVKQELVRDGGAYDLTANCPAKTGGITSWNYSGKDVSGKTHKVIVASSDVTVTAGYDETIRPVTYVVLYGDGSMTQTVKYGKVGEAFPLYGADPAEAGYKFSGWKQEITCKNDYAFPETMPAQGTNESAQIMICGKMTADPNSYRNVIINYLVEPVSGTTYDLGKTETKSAPVNSFLTKEYLTKRAKDYEATLTGCTLDSDNLQLKSDYKVKDADNVINIRYIRSPHTLTINYLEMLDDGTQTTTPVAPKDEGTYKFGVSYNVVSPAVTGYALADGQPAAVAGDMGTEDVTVNVYYKAIPYTVTYLVNGVQYGSVETYHFGDALPKERDLPTETGYSFTPWKVTGKVNGVNATVDYPGTMPDYNLVLSTVKTVDTYQVRYYVDGALYRSYSYVYNTAVDALLPQYTREGYTTTRWQTEHGAEWYTLPERMPAYDVLCYCTTSINAYTITYYVTEIDGKTGTSTRTQYGAVETVNFEANTPKKRAVPAETGWTLSGTDWSVANAAGTAITYPEKMPASNLTLEITRTHDAHTVTYIVDRTTLVQLGGSYYEGEGYTIAAEREHAGFVFSGWFIGETPVAAGAARTMGNADVVVKGSFTALHTVRYTVRVLGGDGKAVSTEAYGTPKEYAEGTQIDALSAAPEARTGYDFLGWTRGGTAAASDLGLMGKTDIEIVGDFKPHTHNVNFYVVSGTETTLLGTAENVAYGEALAGSAKTIPNDPKGQYTYSTAWTYKTTADAAYTAATMPDEDLNAYVTKTPVMHTLTVNYVVNDTRAVAATAPAGKVETMLHGTNYVVATAAQSATTPTVLIPELAGYTSSPNYTADTLNKDTVVTVTYTPVAYTVTYAPGAYGDFTDQVSTDKYIGDDTPAFVGDATSKDPGFYFTGWAPAVDAKVKGDAVYVAQWAPVTVIQLRAAEGTTRYNSAEQAIEGFAPIVLPAGPNGEVITLDMTGVTASTNGTTVAEYTNTVFTGTPKVLVDGVEDVQGQYAVQFVPGKLTVLPARLTVTANGGAKVAGAADPAFTATFNFVDPVAETQADFLYLVARTAAGNNVVGTYPVNVAMAAADYPNFEITLVPGVFTVTPIPLYTLTFLVSGGPYGGGTILSAVGGYAAGAAIAPIADVVLDGYTFSGWDAMPAVMPANDLIVRGTLTPVVPEPDPEPDPEPIPDPEPEIIPDEPVALAGEGRAWALLNLLLTIATAIGSALMLAGYAGKKKLETEDGSYRAAIKKKGKTRLFSLLPAVGAIVAFILTENINNPMVFTDNWTLLMAVIAVVQLAVAIFAKKKEEKLEDDEVVETI